MNDCEGRDQVVGAINQGGWRSYEPPLPDVISKICNGWKPVFFDIGANTGYYSLLAASAGAKKVYAFEPVPSIYEIFLKNIQESAMSKIIETHQLGVGDVNDCLSLYIPDAGHGLIETSASLNKEFRGHHSAEFKVDVITLDSFSKTIGDKLFDQQILMKIDVETLEPEVIMGGRDFISDFRPVIAIEILPDSNVDFFENFCSNLKYDHIWLRSGHGFEVTHGRILTSLDHRDHLLIPREKAGIL
jgi:FkbM family methyltransferase